MLINVNTLSPSFMPIFAPCLTIGAYLLGVEIQKRWRSPLLNPVLIAIVLVGVALRLCSVSYSAYFSGAQMIHLLLGPATVALAIPLVVSIDHIRHGARTIFTALVVGSVTGMVSGYALVRLLGGSQLVALSMLPKSATTPIAIVIAQSLGGIPSLSAVLAIGGGILVAVWINPILRSLKWDSPQALGIAAGTAGSGIGASQVIPQHPLAAAFAGLAIGLNGLLTAVLAPLIANLLKH